ncbi:MAG TPA: ROK family protein [Dokdonella sp.]|uniref:ROK family protein n=1 Tax=Dokdonella sp. TaxID=2291710 RepID=UPI002CCB1910|nr:ROK family protein [Dokdonella sp.]HUD41698.1 ROK family protein [Dokdonella sp.]
MPRSSTATERRRPLPNADAVPDHGASILPAVRVTSYNLALRAGDGYLGDRANKRAFYRCLDQWRAVARLGGDDPFGVEDSSALGRKALERAYDGRDARPAATVQGAIESFANALADVATTFLVRVWPGVQRIAVGGGFRRGRIGEVAIARTQALLRARGVEIGLVPIADHPDAAGLLGGVHLLPQAALAESDALLAVDIGGSNLRCGLLRLRHAKDDDALAPRPKLAALERWRHRDEPVGRDAMIDTMARMLERLIAEAAQRRWRLARHVVVGCPGQIAADGGIGRGTQNLPGDWSAPAFHLPSALQRRLPRIGRARTQVLMHNDAVVQGLSQLRLMRDIERWAILTIGTGLGNAAFENVAVATAARRR